MSMNNWRISKMNPGVAMRNNSTKKNLELNYEGFEPYLETRREDWFVAGVHYIFKFPNHYGASVVKHEYSHGWGSDRWELAVIEWHERWYETEGVGYFLLNYKTPITDDVVGWLTDEGVRDILQKIKDLPYYIDTAEEHKEEEE